MAGLYVVLDHKVDTGATVLQFVFRPVDPKLIYNIEVHRAWDLAGFDGAQCCNTCNSALKAD